MNKISKALKNGGIFVILIGITFYLIFKDNSIAQIIETISKVDIGFIVLAVMCMAIFICCEGINIGRSLKLFGYETSLIQNIKYALIGFFFSSITPSASGGQPMQVYYMHKEGIDISHSALALLIELASFQIVTVTMAVVGYFYKWNFFETLGNVRFLIFAGVMLNIIALSIILMAIFSEKAMGRLVVLFIFVLKKFKCSKVDMVYEKIDMHLKEYRSSAMYFAKNKWVIGKILITTFLQILALHSITFLVYKSLGLDGFSYVTVIALQAVLYVSVSALPFPGAVGISESGFMVLFKTIFPAGLLGSALVLCRGINFYLFLLISGIAVSFISIKRNKKIEKS